MPSTVIPKVLLHLSRDRLEVVQIALLMPRGQLSKQGSATVHQVRPSFVEISGHHKELLLPTQVAAHGLKVKESEKKMEIDAMVSRVW